MNSTWRKHWIVCLCLALLAVPTYFLDQAFAGGGSGGWITLDFRGLILWTYVAWLATEIVLSSIAVRFFPRAGTLRIHFGSMLLAMIMLVAGVVVYGQLRRQAISNDRQASLESRRPLINVLELKNWWYVPDEANPTEIDVRVVVRDSGRFVGNVTGEQTDSSGSARTVFESTNGPESQRQVGKGEAFTYAFPLKILDPARADNVRITLYLFKAQSGPAVGDITKVFVHSPAQDDDGNDFYGVLPAPSRPAK